MSKKNDAADDDSPPKDEGARSFAHFVLAIDQGALNAELSDELRELAKKLHETTYATGNKAKGEIVLKLSFVADTDRANTVHIAHDVKVKLPKVKRSSGGTFWLTKGNNFATEQPRQQKLPLREVGGTTASARELDPLTTEARSI